MPPNGPELSCGDEAAAVNGRLVRAADIAMSVNKCFSRAAKSSTAGSVSLSDWLGRTLLFLNSEHLHVLSAQLNLSRPMRYAT